MSELSIRVETIALSSSPTTSGGQIDTPNQRDSAQSGGDPLSTVQRAARIGDSVPIVFGRRVGNAGGVLVSPPATEARFTNNSSNDVTAYYLVVISEGRIDPIQVRDVFQQSCRVGSFTQAFDRRAGTWGPGNFITTQTGFEDSVPDAPIYCGSGTGSYAGMTTGSFINTIPHPFTQWDRQVHMFVRGGMWVERLLESGEGPSNNVADLVRLLMRRSSRVPEALIDATALLEAARFTNANGLWCNIRIDEPSNLADWLAKNLGYFLLRESRRGGKKGLRPLLPFNPATGALNTSAIGWSFTFTEDHILPGTLEINYSSRVERQPFCCQVVWRQQPEDGLGLARTAEVRYAGSALDGPFEQHDLSAFATTEDHAFKVGAYILARRRYTDHRMVFSVRPGSFTATLVPGNIVRVRMRRVASIGTNTVHDYLYEVERIDRSVTGEVVLELTHFPVDDQGRSLVALDVSRAQGNGLMLPTGRAEVSCDLNSIDDTTFDTDFGPWPEWDIQIPDPALYEDDFTDQAFDLGDGWGLGLEETVNVDFEEIGWEADWVWNDDLEEWQWIGDPNWEWNYETDQFDWIGDANWEWNYEDNQFDWIGDVNWEWNYETNQFDWVGIGDPIGEPPNAQPPNAQPPDSRPPNYTPDADFVSPSGLEGDDAFSDPDGIGYTATVSFSTALIIYPNVWYAILQPNFALASVTVSVDNPPVDGGLSLSITDGTTNAVNPEAGQFGGGNVYGVFIPEGETSATVAINAFGDSVSTATSRAFSITSWAGGGYKDQPADPGADPPQEFVPALDITATSAFTIEPYVGTISLQQPGIWTYDGTDWSWAGGETGDFEWNENNQEWTWNGAAADWVWNAAQSRWEYPGTATGWSWNVTAQRWVRTTTDPAAAPTKPSDPPAGPPSPIPSEVTAAGKSYTVVAQASVDKPAIPNGANDLEIDLQDFDDDGTVAVGTLVIPAISMMFGSWRWNPAAGWWQYPTQSTTWRWHSANGTWEYLQDSGDWTWSQAEEEWQGGTGSAPSGPPQQNSSTHPPDAARWIYSNGWSGTAHWPGGTAPDFTGLLSGSLTYHMV
jgi:hypothetical protein